MLERHTRKLHIRKHLNETSVQENVPQPPFGILLSAFIYETAPVHLQKNAEERPCPVGAVTTRRPKPVSVNDMVPIQSL